MSSCWPLLLGSSTCSNTSCQAFSVLFGKLLGTACLAGCRRGRWKYHHSSSEQPILQGSALTSTPQGTDRWAGPGASVAHTPVRGLAGGEASAAEPSVPTTGVPACLQFSLAPSRPSSVSSVNPQPLSIAGQPHLPIPGRTGPLERTQEWDRLTFAPRADSPGSLRRQPLPSPVPNTANPPPSPQPAPPPLQPLSSPAPAPPTVLLLEASPLGIQVK